MQCKSVDEMEVLRFAILGVVKETGCAREVLFQANLLRWPHLILIVRLPTAQPTLITSWTHMTHHHGTQTLVLISFLQH